MADATVVITTRNRCAELCDAIQSVLNQKGRYELIVVDDGSTDGTAKVVSEKYPEAILIRHEERRGLVASRNEAAARATAPYIFSIDDDAVYTSPTTIREALEAFDDPRVGALALPYINVHESKEVRSCCPDDGVDYAVFTFVGTAHAHRKSVFEELNGYRSFLFHWGEERDYCVRLYEAGFIVQVCKTLPIHHFVSPKRNRVFDNRFLYRNQVLFPYLNAPFRYMLPLIFRALLWNLLDVVRKPIYIRAWLPAHASLLRDLFAHSQDRHPVSAKTFRVITRLHRLGCMPADDVKVMLDAN